MPTKKTENTAETVPAAGKKSGSRQTGAEKSVPRKSSRQATAADSSEKKKTNGQAVKEPAGAKPVSSTRKTSEAGVSSAEENISEEKKPVSKKKKTSVSGKETIQKEKSENQRASSGSNSSNKKTTPSPDASNDKTAGSEKERRTEKSGKPSGEAAKNTAKRPGALSDSKKDAPKSRDEGKKRESSFHAGKTEQGKKALTSVLPEGGRSSKTPQLLALLNRGSHKKEMENPIISEDFKKNVIKPKAAAQRQYAAGVNVVTELVQEWLPEALRRFRCCTCETCRQMLTVRAMNEIPPRYVIIREDADLMEAEKEKQSYEHTVLLALVRLALEVRSHPPHETNANVAAENESVEEEDRG